MYRYMKILKSLPPIPSSCVPHYYSSKKWPVFFWSFFMPIKQ